MDENTYYIFLNELYKNIINSKSDFVNLELFIDNNLLLFNGYINLCLGKNPIYEYDEYYIKNVSFIKYQINSIDLSTGEVTLLTLNVDKLINDLKDISL